MKTFKELEYTRIDEDTMVNSVKQRTEELKNAKNAGEAEEVFFALQEDTKEVMTQSSIAHIRNTVDMNDKFYEDEVKYWSGVMPKIAVLRKEFNTVLLESPYRKELEERWGSLLFKNLETQKIFADERLVEDKIEESNLSNEYAKTVASAKTEFNNESCNFYGLLKYMTNPDRNIRKEALVAWSNLYESIAPKLDELYDKLCENRRRQAKTLGFDSYIDMVYLQRERYDYTPKDIENFRNNIKKYIVPVAKREYLKQQERLGVDKLHYYDESLFFKEGNPVPQGTTSELVDKAQKMYAELSEETKEFFDFMKEHELFDLETKEGKRQGGYATSLPKYKAPFIFSNFNGTSADVDVLTHEAGHCFMGYLSARSQKIMDYCWSTSEINEIHSMAMEFFTHPWMELFFNEDADKYRQFHLSDSYTNICYLTAVDEFQHKVFERENTTADERKEIWHQIEEDYLPWRDYDGIKFLEEGGFWMQKQHIFLYPFYYIDYALAQLCALQYFIRMNQDNEKAWSDYLHLCKMAGSKGYFELLKEGNLDNPFKEETISSIVEGLEEYL